MARYGGWVRRKQDDSSEMMSSLAEALALTEDHEATRALLRPAVECWQREDLAGVENALRPLLLEPDETLRALTQLVLADVHGVRGELEDGLLLLRLAAGSGHREIAPLAACELGNWLEQYGALESAQDAYQQAIDSGHRKHGVRARGHLAYLWYFEGRRAEAEDLLRAAIDGGVAPWSGQAALLLANIRFDEGDLEGAYEAFRTTAGLDAVDAADEATVMLAALIDLGCGGEGARADFAGLERAEASSERAAFIRAVLARWNEGQQGTDDPMGAVEPDWARHYAAAMRFQRER